MVYSSFILHVDASSGLTITTTTTTTTTTTRTLIMRHLVFLVVQEVRVGPYDQVDRGDHQARRVLSYSCLQRHTHTPTAWTTFRCILHHCRYSCTSTDGGDGQSWHSTAPTPTRTFSPTSSRGSSREYRRVVELAIGITFVTVFLNAISIPKVIKIGKRVFKLRLNCGGFFVQPNLLYLRVAY